MSKVRHYRELEAGATACGIARSRLGNDGAFDAFGVQSYDCPDCLSEPSGIDPGAPQGAPVDSGATEELEGSQIFDPVERPAHYQWLPVEAIEITERFNFCMGNALKYILRADHKGNPVEDLEKAVWYLRRELANRRAYDTP